MRFVSVSSVLTLIFLCYLGNTLWTLTEMFTAPGCNKGEKCLSSYLTGKPNLNLIIYSSVKQFPHSSHVKKVRTILNFDYSSPQQFDLEVDVESARRKNGTLYLHVGLVDSSGLYDNFDTVRSSTCSIPLVVHMLPQASTFNLLNHKETSESEDSRKGMNIEKPLPHIDTEVEFSVMTDKIKTPFHKMPSEFQHSIRISQTKFMPLIQHNMLKSRMKNLKLLDESMRVVNVSVSYSPASYGMFRLMTHIMMTFSHLKIMGFGEKDVDDVKGIFADTNLYLLCATVVIASCHLLFDFLAFKNDVAFWRRKKSMAGLSTRTVLWRAFSTCVILLYLMDENTSLIVLIPACISALIELWKAKKVLHVSVAWVGGLPRLSVGESKSSQAEQRTRAVDAEAMRYLSYLLYPLCVAGAIYSLLYEPHKSWYSWSLHSLVNGVYAFGFLFMLPQLFVNYKLRSVAALPWRAFMYKAFNTFIDDVFAFIITMPTAHRVACFRDDVVFLIYLYQRWLYPVDASRIDDSLTMDEAIPEPNKLKKS